MLEPLESSGASDSRTDTRVADSGAAGAASPPPPPATDRDVQRAALRELVELASTCAVVEGEIEARLRRELDDAQQKLAKATDDAAAALTAKQEEVAARSSARAGEIDAIAERELAALKQTFADRRSRIQLDNESMEQELRTQLEKAEWLAESLFEGAQNHLRAEVSKLNESVATELRTIDERESAANELMARYGVSIPRGGAESEAEVPTESASTADAAQVDRDVRAFREEADYHLEQLRSLFLPKLFVGVRPVVIMLLLCAVGAVVGQLVAVDGVPADVLNEPPQWREIGMAAGGTFAGVLVIGLGLMFLARSQVRKAYLPFRAARDGARRAADAQRAVASKNEQRKLAHARRKRDMELAAAREKFTPTLERIRRNRAAAVGTVEQEYKRNKAKIDGNRDASRAELDTWRTKVLGELQQRHNAQLQAARDAHDAARSEIERRHADARANLQKKWEQGLRAIQAPIEETGGGNGQVIDDWTSMNWKQWSPPRKFTSKVRFGELQVDLQRITDDLPRSLALPPAFALPAVLALPRQASLLIHTNHAGRGDAIHILQMLMARLLTSLPAGRVRFTIIDPVSLGQNFAGFMHLADHDEALVGGRIWTEPEHIEQRLADLTEHMETVIQKYLRNEFETIDDYNAQAGELAEPYRFLVIADLPAGFSSDAFRRLSSIAASGARCGIYTLVMRDTGQALPSGSRMDQLESSSVNLVREGDRFVWRDEVFQQFPLTVDAPPPESSLTEMLDVVGKAAKENKRIEVSFDTIAPAPDRLWSRSTAEEVEVPIGRLGATRLQNLRLGRGVAQHVLIAGKTGSGKSTLLHALVTNLAMWYSPQEVEFYLVDFKKGVEFKTYATHRLPHARAIAVESDREFGLSVLQRVDAELARRGELFRKAGTQDLASYRKSAGAVPMPRTLLIIDEFQEFFSEDDKLAQDAGVLLDRLVRQGRAFGIHVLLGSQTIGGSSGLARSTIGQMAVRIALQTSEADSQLILGDTNSAARLLSRPGEAIYNDQGGLVEGNSPFQIAWLPDPKREIYLARVREKADAADVREEPGVVFEGNAPADVRKNTKLAALLAGTDGVARSPVPLGWLGDPVAIKDPTAVAFRRQSSANVLIVGQQDEGAMGIMATAMVGLAAQDAQKSAKFYVLDGTPADSPLAGTFSRVAEAIPQATELVEWRAVESTIDALSQELARRQASDESNPPPIYLFVYGLQRYRMLRKSEDDFSFGSSGDEEKKANPGKQFAELLREGPPHGMHVLAWSDTPAAIERTLDRTSLREFDNRVLFQMSANDSSNLIDSPMANKLGQNRALAYSEEQGVMEKFRPYAVPGEAWLRDVKSRLTAEAQRTQS